MDYIQNRLLKNIARRKQQKPTRYSTISRYYELLFQYLLYLMLACIFDRRSQNMEQRQRMTYLQEMSRASMGKLLDLVCRLDQEGGGDKVLALPDVFREEMGRVVEVRNDGQGHGTLVPGVQENEFERVVRLYEEVYEKLCGMNIPLLVHDCAMIYMPEAAQGSQQVWFEKEDYSYKNLAASVLDALDLQPGEFYYYFDNASFRISPFLIVREVEFGENPYEIYCYKEFNLRNGQFTYNKYSDLDSAASYTRISKDYFLSFQKDYDHTIVKPNGVICNKFANNYDYFITTPPIDGYAQKVWKFISSNKSNICLTIRGGGGIGKTALVQYLCTKKIFESERPGFFRYVIFCTAKDREFRQGNGSLVGQIQEYKDGSVVHGYEDIIQIINWVLDIVPGELAGQDDIRKVEEGLSQTDGVLLVIDDFETLSEEDKNKVIALSSQLDINRHKMLLTTRSQYMIGEEFYIDNLSRKQTINFMKERFLQGNMEEDGQRFADFAKDPAIATTIFQITRGLPLLAIQLVNILQMDGFCEESLHIGQNEEVEDFLMGRLSSYFGTPSSRVLFLVIAYYIQYSSNITDLEIDREAIHILYRLYCKRLSLPDIDYDGDLKELRKLNIITEGDDYIRLSGHISARVIHTCEQNMEKETGLGPGLFDSQLFKDVFSAGMYAGIQEYSNSPAADIDEPFVQLFVYDNCERYPDDIRLTILGQYVRSVCDSSSRLEDIYHEAYPFFDQPDELDVQFHEWSKALGLAIPELEYLRIQRSNGEERSTPEQIQDIVESLNEEEDAIDNILLKKRRGGISNSYYLEEIQRIRGEIGEILNIRLAGVWNRDEAKDPSLYSEVQTVIQEISQTREFEALLDNDIYKQICG